MSDMPEAANDDPVAELEANLGIAMQSDDAPRIAIIVAQFNPRVTSGLLNGALNYFKKQKISVDPADIYQAPGAFELPLIAKKLAQSGSFDGVVCLGCVIKGDTAHFEYISAAASQGLMQVGLETGVPVSFGILTTYDSRQARMRSRNNSKNKGIEAAAACFETIQILRDIPGPVKE